MGPVGLLRKNWAMGWPFGKGLSQIFLEKPLKKKVFFAGEKREKVPPGGLPLKRGDKKRAALMGV